MSLHEQLAVDASIFTSPDDFGEVVTWTKKDGTVIPDMPLLFVQGQAMIGGSPLAGGSASAIENGGTIMIAMALVTPGAGDSFVRANGEVWKIDRTSQRNSDGVFWRINVVSDRLLVLRGN